MPTSDFGAQWRKINALKAPVPQPTSSHCARHSGSSQAKNFAPIARLHRP
jgi:hypothetical protein